MVFVWIRFAICVAIIAIAGRKVARYADIIAEKTGIGGLWIGLVLLAIVTSLPELFNGISAVALVKAPDLTIGDLFGSNAINLLILAWLDIAYHNRPLLTAASSRHLLPAGLSMVLVALGTLCILISSRVHDLGIGWIGIYTPVIILLYLFMMRVIFLHEQRHLGEPLEERGVAPNYEHISLRSTYVRYAIAALFVIGAGTWLAFVGDDMAEETGWGRSFVGSLFIAFTTSLPEIAVSFAALRLGAVDMSVANMIGSNLFNMTIIGIDDIFYRQGPVLAAVSESHFFTGLVVLAMTVIVIAGIFFGRRRRRLVRVSWYAPVLTVVYIVGAYIIFITGD